MIRFGMAALTVLLVPAASSAEWIYTSMPQTYQVGMSGVGQVYTGGWETYFYNGDSPYGEPATGLPGTRPNGFVESAITYCVSVFDNNSNPDAYNIDREGFAAQYSGEIFRALSYILAEVDPLDLVDGDVFKARAVIQAAIWQSLALWDSSGRSVNGVFNDSSLDDVFDDLMVEVTARAEDEEYVAPTGSSFAFGDPTEGSQNQDMIWIDGPNGEIDPVVPLPASFYGALTLLGACFVGRRMFGIAV